MQASTDERECSPTTTENSSNSPHRSRSEKMNCQQIQWRHHSAKQQLPVSVSESEQHHHGPLKLKPRYPSTRTNMLSGNVTSTKNVYRLNNRRPTVQYSNTSCQPTAAASGVVKSSSALYKTLPRHPHPNKYSINRTIPIVTTAAAAIEVPLTTVSNKRKYDPSKYKYISPDAYKTNGTRPENIDFEYSKDSKNT